MLFKDILLILLISCLFVTAISLVVFTIYTYKNGSIKAREKQRIEQQAIQNFIREINKEND